MEKELKAQNVPCVRYNSPEYFNVMLFIGNFFFIFIDGSLKKSEQLTF